METYLKAPMIIGIKRPMKFSVLQTAYHTYTEESEDNTSCLAETAKLRQFFRGLFLCIGTKSKTAVLRIKRRFWKDWPSGNHGQKKKFV